MKISPEFAVQLTDDAPSAKFGTGRASRTWSTGTLSPAMMNQRNTVRVFVMADSAPVRRRLLRMFGEIPAVELVGVERSETALTPTRVAELAPDLLLLDIKPRHSGAIKLFDYISQNLPHCRTVVLSPPDAAASIMHCVDTQRGTGGTGPAFVNPVDAAGIRAEIQKSIDDKQLQFAPQRFECRPGALYVRRRSDMASGSPLRTIPRQINDRRKLRAGRRRSEISSIESAERFQSFVEQLPGMPYIAHLDNDGQAIYVSPRIKDILGFTPEQWCASPALRIAQVHGEDREEVRQAIRQAVDTLSGYTIDYRIHASDGTLRWLHDEARVMIDETGKPLFWQGVMLDITERRHAQDELKKSHAELQELIAILDALRAEEQKRLAHEMHDDFGQLLAAMKIDLCTLRQRVPAEDTEVAKYLGSISNLVDAMVTSVRRIIADLPPKIVEDLGLCNALKSMIRSFEQRHQLRCELLLHGCSPELNVKVATALYRMVQETLNNVAKHAQATSIRVEMACDKEAIALCVADNGTGISPTSLGKAGSFGLIGIRERAHALGGEMKIDSSSGQGATIRIVIPINQALPQSKD